MSDCSAKQSMFVHAFHKHGSQHQKLVGRLYSRCRVESLLEQHCRGCTSAGPLFPPTGITPFVERLPAFVK